VAFSLSSKPRSPRGIGLVQYMGLHEILPPGSRKNRAKLRKDIEEYHTAYAIKFNDADIDTFIARRLDGLAFDNEEKLCVVGTDKSNDFDHFAK